MLPGLSVFLATLGSPGLLGYVGLPGQELIPYFLALLAFVGAALGAVLQWPLVLLLRRVRRSRGAQEPPAAAIGPETGGDGKHDQL